jgi:hypothetical protein
LQGESRKSNPLARAGQKKEGITLLWLRISYPGHAGLILFVSYGSVGKRLLSVNASRDIIQLGGGAYRFESHVATKSGNERSEAKEESIQFIQVLAFTIVLPDQL